jgi:hypothetical protein
MSTNTIGHDSGTKYDDLSTKIWMTKGARFCAHERLRRQFVSYSNCIAVLSVYCVALSIAPQFLALSKLQSNVLALASVVLSVFVIVLSQTESGKNQLLISDAMHRCALALSRIHDEYILELQSGMTNERKSVYVQRYHGELDAAPNHENGDYDLFRARHASSPEVNWGYGRAVFVVVTQWIRYSWLYLVFMIGLPALAILLVVRLEK